MDIVWKLPFIITFELCPTLQLSNQIAFLWWYIFSTSLRFIPQVVPDIVVITRTWDGRTAGWTTRNTLPPARPCRCWCVVILTFQNIATYIMSQKTNSAHHEHQQTWTLYVMECRVKMWDIVMLMELSKVSWIQTFISLSSEENFMIKFLSYLPRNRVRTL